MHAKVDFLFQASLVRRMNCILGRRQSYIDRFRNEGVLVVLLNKNTARLSRLFPHSLAWPVPFWFARR